MLPSCHNIYSNFNSLQLRNLLFSRFLQDNSTMTLKIKNNAFESLVFPTKKNLKGGLSKKMLLEIQQFQLRNSLAAEIPNLGVAVKECCPQCLKAHLIKINKRLRNPALQARINLLDCETGHNGYYRDAERLVRV